MCLRVQSLTRRSQRGTKTVRDTVDAAMELHVWGSLGAEERRDTALWLALQVAAVASHEGPLGSEAERELVPWLTRWRVNLEHSEHAGLY